jgi:hypothetical protein
MKRPTVVRRAVALLSCTLISGIAGAAHPGVKAPAARRNVTPAASVTSLANPCPPGWHKTSGSAGSAFICAPNKPVPIQCPPKTQYFDSGCSVGCSAIIY